MFFENNYCLFFKSFDMSRQILRKEGVREYLSSDREYVVLDYIFVFFRNVI